MARNVRDGNLETRTARTRLKVRHKPYSRLIEPGLYLLYRRKANAPGTWIVRRYVGGKIYATENLRTVDQRLVVADDYSDADGNTVLSFAQAQERAKKMRPGDGSKASVKAEDYTVAQAMDDYFEHLEGEGRSPDGIADARYRDSAHIRPKLGERRVATLTAEELRTWRNALAKAPARLRTKDGDKQKHREAPGDENAIRARRASANRTWTALRAALNRAFKEKKVTHADEWRRVEPFKGVDKARLRYLTVAESKRLINACDAELRSMVQAALLTGARYGQLTHVTVADFNPDAGTLRVSTRKGDGTYREYHITLTAEGVAFFKQTCAGRTGAELIFTHEDGSAWLKSQQDRPIKEACEHAKIEPAIGIHILRHTWASHSVMNGVPLLVVAKNMGHTDTRMVERHYGHLAPSFITEAIRKGAPKFDIKADKKVIGL